MATKDRNIMVECLNPPHSKGDPPFFQSWWRIIPSFCKGRLGCIKRNIERKINNGYTTAIKTTRISVMAKQAPTKPTTIKDGRGKPPCKPPTMIKPTQPKPQPPQKLPAT